MLSYQLIYFGASRHNKNVNKSQRDLSDSDKTMNKDGLTEPSSVFISHHMPTGNVLSYIFLMHVANKHVKYTTLYHK